MEIVGNFLFFLLEVERFGDIFFLFSSNDNGVVFL